MVCILGADGAVRGLHSKETLGYRLLFTSGRGARPLKCHNDKMKFRNSKTYNFSRQLIWNAWAVCMVLVWGTFSTRKNAAKLTLERAP